MESFGSGDSSIMCPNFNLFRSQREHHHVDSSSESLEGAMIPRKREKKYKKIVQPKCKNLSKFVDLTEKVNEKIEFNYESSCSEDEIKIDKKEKVINNSFLEKIRQKKEDSLSMHLAKSLFANKTPHDFIEVSAPLQLQGFMSRKQVVNPRDIFRENLKSEINSRKTTHIQPEMIFSKSVSDLPGKGSKQQDNDSDYVVSENEESEAIELEKIIKLEEGELSDPSSDHEKLSSHSEDLLELENQSKSLEMSTKSDDLLDSDLDESSSSSEKSQPSAENIENSQVLQKIFPKNVKVSKFVDNEAEIGSDHEEHDDLVKNFKDSDEESAEDDEELEELLDREKVEDNEDVRYEKHFDQLLEEDEAQIKRVVNAEFKKQRKNFDFVENSTDLMSKKQKLMEDKKKLIAGREGVGSGFGPVLEAKDDEEIDEEEIGKYKIIKGSQQLKFIRNQFDNKIVLDEKSLGYLSFISKPQLVVSSKSLLSDKAKSMDKRVFQSKTDLSSNRSFVFSKDRELPKTNQKEKVKKTKLFKLLTL